MKNDRLISLNAAIDAMMKLQTEDIEAYGASIPEGFDGDRAVTALKALPSAQPTLYGYNLRNLIVFADAVNKKGISDFEIEDFVRNARAAWEYAWEEFQRTQKEALDSIMQGDHHEP